MYQSLLENLEIICNRFSTMLIGSLTMLTLWAVSEVNKWQFVDMCINCRLLMQFFLNKKNER